MILRTSSISAASSSLSPFSDSPSPTPDLHSFNHNNLSSLTFHHHNKGFRTTLSDGNLHRFLSQEQDLPFPIIPTKNHIMLHSAPSFSLYNVNGDIGEEAESRNNGGGGEEEVLMRTVTIGESIMEATSNGDFSFGKKKMGLIEEEESSEDEQIQNLNLEPENEPLSPPMFLASGLGIDSFDIGAEGGGFHSNLPNFDESVDLEDYYKRMVDEYPCHPLFLANYAQLLQAKGELDEAEESYHRASMADPEDGEILLKYAILEWQLHHVKDRALSNFERAVQAAPHNSQVLAAYASFLWEIDDDDEDEDAMHLPLKQIEVQDSTASQDFKPLINASACNDENVEEYYKRMIEEYPSDSLVLRNYAQFLYQTKRDLPGAEEYYSRAVLADPGDGEIKSQYAKLVWEYLRDHDRASSYFEQAVEAAPEDSNVLAAYARFLWQTEENEEQSTSQDPSQDAIHHEASVTATA